MLAWGLSQLFIPLAIVPLPVIIFFGALALPLRKDQPMEIYMAAMVSFYLKPHRRLWDPDGVDSLIEITAPKIIEYSRTKDLSQTEAERRFGYLAEIVDSQGWAIRGSDIQAPNSAMTSDAYFEAQGAQDVLDNDNYTSQSLSDKLDKSEAIRRQNAINIMKNKFAPTEQPVAPVEPPEITQTMPSPSSYFGGVPLVEPTVAPEPTESKPIAYNPYPTINQSVIDPIGQGKPSAPAVKPKKTTSENVVSTGIINLASNTDLTIAAIAREANRIQEKEDANKEVVIQLR
jgi:hypothetical protein